MTQMVTPVNDVKSPLVAAQKIVSELQGMSKDHQSLAIKFAIETLDLQVAIAPAQVLPAPMHQTQATQPATTATPGQATDIKSFTTAKAPKSDQQFAAVVAYFYQFEAPATQRKDSIDAATMKDAARLAVWGQVRDWNMTLNNATRSGYLDRSDRGSFKLSSVGENLVAITLPGNGSAAQGNGGGPAKKGAKKKPSPKKANKKVR